MKIRTYLRYFVSYSLWKPFFGSKSQETPSNLTFVIFLVTLRPLDSFNLNLEKLSGKKSPNICFTW